MRYPTNFLLTPIPPGFALFYVRIQAKKFLANQNELQYTIKSTEIGQVADIRCFCALCSLLQTISVEPEGIEPSSKHGTNVLSTCLSMTLFSSVGKAHGCQPTAYPVCLGMHPGLVRPHSRFDEHHLID